MVEKKNQVSPELTILQETELSHNVRKLSVFFLKSEKNSYNNDHLFPFSQIL